MAETEPDIIETPPAAGYEPQGVDPLLAARRPRKVNAGIWGVPEILAVSAGALGILLAVLLYLFLVLPSSRELAKDRSENDRLGAEVASAETKYGDITSTHEQVNKLLTSADDFETRFLPAAVNGRTELYGRLNALIVGYGLRNTTGPDYQPLDVANPGESNNQTEQERGRERFRSLFPGVYVTMTLEGPYQNLRRFIREIETGREFVIISSVELAPSDTEQRTAPAQTTSQNTGAAVPPDPTGAQPMFVNPTAGPAAGAVNPKKGKMHGEVVALRLEMAAYFRRPDFAPMAAAE